MYRNLSKVSGLMFSFSHFFVFMFMVCIIVQYTLEPSGLGLKYTQSRVKSGVKVKLGALWPGPQSHTVQTHMGVLSDRARESQLDRPIAYTIDETFP